MNDQAKKILEDQGWDTFRKVYGDYYISGTGRGASMQVIVKATST
jgi:hypothetical protein